MPYKVMCVAGARPNFVKIAPLLRALKAESGLVPILVHTGQHYDDKLSAVFFRELDIPQPDVSLGVGSGSHAGQTADLMKSFESVVTEHQPQVVLVVGDVNSTVACALVASKFRLDSPFRFQQEDRHRPLVVHVEAGLRSGDRNMPEEINRIVTDSISDLLFTTEEGASENLIREGVDASRIHFVGNVMIDTLRAAEKKAESSGVLSRLGLSPKGYCLVTLHRPSNVDNEQKLAELLSALDTIAHTHPILFAVHPRTQNRLADMDVTLAESRWTLCPPLGYLDFIAVMKNAALVCSDSGGIQEETTILGVPCLTLRDNTERPVTITHGSNVLSGTSGEGLLSAFRALDPSKGGCPPLWDGKTAPRIARIISESLT